MLDRARRPKKRTCITCDCFCIVDEDVVVERGSVIWKQLFLGRA